MAVEESKQAPSALLQYLPAVYHEHAFLGQFLLAFEKILLGRSDPVVFEHPGLEETIATIAAYFDPVRAREDFLPWLAGWVALSLRADLDLPTQRDFIAKSAQLYRWRGTKQNLIDLVRIFTGTIPVVDEPEGAMFQIGRHSTVGLDTYIHGGPPHFFKVKITLPKAAPEVQERQIFIARALIELEKPAHTFYDLEVSFPSMQLKVTSTVGVDTLISGPSEGTNS